MLLNTVVSASKKKYCAVKSVILESINIAHSSAVQEVVTVDDNYPTKPNNSEWKRIGDITVYHNDKHILQCSGLRKA